MSETKSLPIPGGLAGERMDAALAKLLGISRSHAAELIEAGAVHVNGKLAAKSDRASEDAMLSVVLAERPNRLEVVASDVAELKIVFEDEHLVVVEKPAGVAAHPSVGWDGPTVVGVLAARGIQIATSGAAERQGIVQRLDVGTSGLMMVAKSEIAYSRLKQAFRDRIVHKTYHALVQGLPDPLEGTIDAPIGRHPKAEFKFTVSSDGKPSITHYKLLEAFAAASLLEIILETGRTHQIRVHMSAFKHPLIGDTMYGADPKLAAKLGIERQWLHAMALEFEHPITGKLLKLSSNYPADLEAVLSQLRGN